MDTPWYRKAFGSRYAELYAHRDKEEAKMAVALLERLAPLRGARVLDVACGAGRHMLALRSRGALAIGLDLSDHLIRRAAAVAPVVQGDMRRLPFGAGRFDGVLNMFTSFGYFEEAEENEVVLREAARVVRPGGWFLFDYLNAETAIPSLVARGEREVGGARVRERRVYDPASRVLTKEIARTDPATGETEEWTERLVLFSPEEIERMVIRAGFSVGDHFGDYEGGSARADGPRLILFCRAASPAGGGRK